MLIEIEEASQAGDARRRAVACAEDLQMGEIRCGEIALATTEIATNLVKHAVRGHILVQGTCEDGDPSLRVMGVDKGPGISDVSRALSDGHSTAGSMGLGLGAIRRISTSFDLYSVPGSGTIVSAEFSNARRNGDGKCFPIDVGVVSEPIAGEDECGDGWAMRRLADTVTLLVVDGLGHGFLAAEAAREAEKVLRTTKEESPTEVLREVHDSLKKTRGAAAAVARIETNQGLVRFAGVGNISASVATPGHKRGLASHNGTLGQSMHRVQEFTCPWAPTSILVMHSDGLANRWDLDQYPGIWNKHPSVIAAILHRDFSRNRDDVTVLVAKALQKHQV
jgi:anti-sigma regulatory factor (Ser/Thr protein kinase)